METELSIQIPRLSPQAESPHIQHWNACRVHTGFHTIAERLLNFKFYEAITYGADFGCIRRWPKRIIIGLRGNERMNSYRVPKPTEARFLRYLHAKVYLLYPDDQMKKPNLAIVGSMNFVYSGQVECAVEVWDKTQLKTLKQIFEDLWLQGERKQIQ
jgi:phosphatidylserine/phosphatidylglycerophosphate/cardiolipin synthase-like enzyme